MHGVIVGCDIYQQWLLPWWWKHYSAHNSYPVAFMDFGMSQEAITWCKERGAYIALPPQTLSITSEKNASVTQKKKWEAWYGEKFWICRKAWLKKPFALLYAPFTTNLWLDLDCQVLGDLEPLFHCLNFGAEIALARDLAQGSTFSLPGEVAYNSGVIAFQKEAPIVEQWIESLLTLEGLFGGDQEILTRAVHLFKPYLVEFPMQFNWPRAYGTNPEALIHHFSSGLGKIAILNTLPQDNSLESLLLLQSMRECVAM